MAQRYGMNMRFLLDHVFNDELNDLKDYVETIEGALRQKWDEFGDDIGRKTAGMTEDQKNEYIEYLTDDAFQLYDRFPSMVRKTAFVFLYGLLEHTLLNLCGHVKKYGRFKESATGRGKDKGIAAAQSYLKDVAMVKFPDQCREWNEIKHMADIRNILAHNKGRVPGEPTTALIQYIKKTKGLIELKGMYEIKFNAGYCDDAIEVIRKFFAKVLKEVPDNLLRRTVEEDTAELLENMKALQTKKK